MTFAENLSEVDTKFLLSLKQNPSQKSITIFNPSTFDHPSSVINQGKLLQTAFETAGYFKSVKVGYKDDDVYALVFLTRKPEEGIGVWISGLSFGILPSITYETITTEVSIRDQETGKANNYKRESKFKVYNGWIFLPLWPFFLEYPEFQKLLNHHIHSILKEAKLDGTI
ncbi:hypothetical protein EHQ75_01925 [Leptospira levettii]|uniref:Uncharacterized protein n=1 Tax=Leptospira levettii TaxID=2023178 RepID=A0AAW5VA67_9LEPT|nr:hypothetical protein [Leptospira levettii]MCW7464397.1 hypothetical protein [Leptospira levettii]MCW7495534.1 hypothetical protein [Leptospira levettii]MCW7511418.1 hypothetical protein [Leptospira levettii]MCW7515173.1 hypothetical protein [Leptospira levettii]TGM28775.1 hypothetical protein EHQ74_05315 [Leptospira levettii]